MLIRRWLAIAVATCVAVPAEAQTPAGGGRPVVSIVYTGRSLGALGVLRDTDEHDLVIEAARAEGLALRLSTWRAWRAPGLTVFAPGRDLGRVDLEAIVAATVTGLVERPALVSNNATLVGDPAGGAPDLVALTRANPRAGRDVPDLVERMVRVGTAEAGRSGRLTVVAERDAPWPDDPAAWTETEVDAVAAGDATLWELPVNLAGAGPRATLVGEAAGAARAAGAQPILVDLGHRSGDLGLEPPDRARLDYYVLATLGYQFVVPYELELGLGIEGLSALHAEYPGIRFLAANVESDPAPDELIERHAIVEAGGVRIGLFGLIDPNLEGVMSRGALADFPLGSPVAAAQREVRALREAGVQAIVALSNLHPRDNALVAREVAGIDAVVADLHVRWSPEQVATDVSLPGRPFVRPGSPALVARGFANGLGVGRLDLSFAGDGTTAVLASLHHELGSVTDRVPADRALVTEVRRRAALAERPRGPVLVPAFGTLVARRAALADYDQTTALGRVSKRMWEEFLARLVRYRAGAEVAVIRKLPHFPPAVGALHEADVRAWLWTDDSIVLADVTGAELRSLLAGDRDNDLRTSGIDVRAGTINGRPISGSVYYRVATTDVLFDGARAGAFRNARRVTRQFTVRTDGRLKASRDGAGLPLRAFVLDQIARLHRAYAPADYEALVAGLLDRDPPFEPLFTFTFDRPTLLGSLSRTANSDGYEQVPESRVRAADSFVVGVAGRYEVSLDRRRWGLDLGVETAYTRQSGTRNGVRFDLENQDDLLFDVRARRKLARQGQRGPQPFVRLLYDTEFTPTTNPDTARRNPRQKLLRGAAGVLLTPARNWTSVELGAVLEDDLTTGRLRWGAQVRTDLVLNFGPLGRLAYRWRNDATWFAPAADDTTAELGLKYSMIHEVLIPLVDEFSLSVGADTYFFRGKVPETSRLGASAILRVGITYDRLWKPRYQPFF